MYNIFWTYTKNTFKDIKHVYLTESVFAMALLFCRLVLLIAHLHYDSSAIEVRFTQAFPLIKENSKISHKKLNRITEIALMLKGEEYTITKKNYNISRGQFLSGSKHMIHINLFF